MSLPTVAIEPNELTNLQWERLFGNTNPVELEIGIGKAGFLLHRAREYPQHNFFGIEWASKFYRFAVDRMQRWGVTNVRIVRTDASHFMRVLCPRNSLTVLHTYHPDPWPKKRHHKRRLFQQPVVNAAVECLIPGGRWAVQTDHAEYFEQIQALLRNHPDLEEIPFNDPDTRIETNYEIKYLREGRTIYQIAARRRN